MLFSFSSPSFHSSFPTCPLFSLNSLLTTCETYAMWLILELPNLLYSLPHHCPHVSVIHCRWWYSCVSCVNNDHFFLSLHNFSSSHMNPLPPPPSPLPALLHDRPGRSHFTCRSYPSSIVIITPFIAPPLIRLNSSSLLPFPLFCRAPVTPSGVTRTVSDSRRTCYLVTRL